VNVQQWYQGLAERERHFVLGGAVAAVLLLIFGVLWPLDQSVSRAQTRLAQKQSDLARMRVIAPQLVGVAPVVPVSNSRSLIAVVDSSAREAGLGTALTNSDPSGTTGLRIRLDKAPFDIVVGWLSRLAQQHGIRVDSATIDSAGSPGLVNAGIVLQAQQR
jgi:general secretion pathway protein M